MPAPKNLSVRPAEEADYQNIVDYFVKADLGFLGGMGVDPLKLPLREEWLKILYENHSKPIEERNIFYVIWLYENTPIGHSNINKIIFGEEAYMHLHMWRSDIRQQGNGLEFMKMSIPYYFKNFKLKKLYCEPYALNPAPNKTLKKLGFDFVKNYETIPGLINFQQPVNRWRLDVEKYQSLQD
jgi:RimJ/RimL family protein N-acetyltransferase